MQAYAELRDCRREYLLQYFGDEEIAAPCGRCDNCVEKARAPQRSAPQHRVAHPFAIHARVIHTQLGKGVVQKYEGDKVEILFDEAGRKTLSLPFLMENEMLQPANEMPQPTKRKR